MKKLFALILTLAMAMSLVACGGSKTNEPASSGSTTPAATTEPAKTDAPAAPTTLTLALRGGTYADVIKECLPAFEAENNVTCDVLELSEGDLLSKVGLDASNKEGAYDLIMVGSSNVATILGNDVAANLSELGYSFDDDIIPATTTTCMKDGQIYLAPYYGNVSVLMFNKQLVADAGYDADSIQSLDDIMKICAAAKAAGKNGFLYRGDNPSNLVVDFLPILCAYGGWVVDENNKPTCTTDEFKAALNFYLDLIATGTAQVKDDIIASIDTGAGAMTIGWPGWYTPTADTTGDYCALRGAAHTGDQSYNANIYGSWTIGIAANSTKKEMALKLLEYLMDADVQYATIPSGGVPCRYSALLDEKVLETYPQYAAVCEALENGVYRPVMEEWTEFYTILGTELDNIVNGVKTVDAGLADAQMQLEMLMG
ncbi:MAG: extracellular solute-binding protein [Oscillibacter sp.]|nr:extracellular solute-binding protein [Oscillibacter sp.]